jgi:hypothetical protein
LACTAASPPATAASAGRERASAATAAATYKIGLHPIVTSDKQRLIMIGNLV